MNSVVEIHLKGICTHLTATHKVNCVDPFKLHADGEEIQHRIFLANSRLINDKIPEGRNVVFHEPKLRIHKDHVLPELRKKMTEHGDFFELLLDGYAVGFENVNHAKGPDSHHHDLLPLPSIRKKSTVPFQLLPGVLNGWTETAGAYVDFTPGVKFTVGEDLNSRAGLTFKGDANITLREKNKGPATVYPLKNDTSLEITNQPNMPHCGDSDYLLHYFATDLDLLLYAPAWGKVDVEEKLAMIEGRKPAGDVYCSNSNYP